MAADCGNLAQGSREVKGKGEPDDASLAEVIAKKDHHGER
jgi:hypothetical protein